MQNLFKGQTVSLRLKQACVFCAVLILLPAAFSCNGPRYSGKQAEDGPRSTAVRVQSPQPATGETLRAPLSGVVQAAGQVRISFQVAGLVDAVFVDEGDVVRQGQQLAHLDLRPFQATLAQAAGQLASAQAQLDLLEEGTRAEDIATAQAQLESAQAVLARAEADYQRAIELFAQGVIARKDYDAAASGYLQAEKGGEAAREQLRKAQEGPRPQEIEQARGAVESASGSRQLAATQLDYAVLKAPAGGVIVMRQLEAGQVVSAGMPVFELADTGQLEISTEIPESDLAQVSAGDKVHAAFPAVPGFEASATVMSVAPNASRTTRGFPVVLRLQEDAGGVAPGMIALVEFAYMKSPGGMRIPARAVIDGHVLIAQDGKAIEKPVQVLLDEGEYLYVDGLNGTDQLIINGQHYVEDGGAVHIVDSLGIGEISRLEAD